MLVSKIIYKIIPQDGWQGIGGDTPYPFPPLYIHILYPPHRGLDTIFENFWEKSPKDQIMPQNRNKNFQKKWEQLDFTYYQMIFIFISADNICG